MTQAPNDQALYDAWAEHYDAVEGDRAPMVAFYRGLVDAHTRSVFDLGCGTGVVLCAIADRLAELHGNLSGCRIVGIDQSQGMLDQARQREPRVEWLAGDVRELPRDGRFDLVVCCYNTLQFMLTAKELGTTLRAVRGLLNPGGRFAFDMFQPDFAGLAQSKQDRLLRRFTAADGRWLELRDDFRYEPASRLLHLEWRITPEGGAAPIAKLRWQMRQYVHAEVQQLLEAAGLRVDQLYGDFDCSPFSERSMRQVLVCSVA